MHRLSVWCLLLLLAVDAHSDGLNVEIVAPKRTTAAPPPGGAAVPDSIAAHGPEVSSIERFKVRFSLESPELVKIVPGKSEQPEFELAAFDSNGKPVPVRHWVVGTSVEYECVTITLAVEIPIDKAERDRQLAAFIDEAIAEETGELADYVKANRHAAIAYLEPLFIQNRVGSFDLRISVRDPRLDPVEGRASVAVVDKGSFVDLLRQPPGEIKRK